MKLCSRHLSAFLIPLFGQLCLDLVTKIISGFCELPIIPPLIYLEVKALNTHYSICANA